MTTKYTAHFYEIVPNERLLCSFDVILDNVIFSVSLATVEFASSEKGTRLTFTEQIALLDGWDSERGVASRIEGTQTHFDRRENILTEAR